MFTTGTPPTADTILWGDQTGIVFSPRPFLKTEEILVDQQPPVKTEPVDNEGVKSEVNSEFIKCEQDVACKEDPDLLTVEMEPVESVYIKSLSDGGPVKTEPVELSSFLDYSDRPSSPLQELGEFYIFSLHARAKFPFYFL